MWGFKDRQFYRFSEVINGCGISETGLDNCILSGLIRVHTWLFPACVFQIEKMQNGTHVVWQTVESTTEGYVAVEPNDYRRMLQKGMVGIRSFSKDDDKYCLRCHTPDVEVRLEDLVILASEKEKLDQYMEQQSRADHAIGMLSPAGKKADTTFDRAFRQVNFRGKKFTFGVMQSLIVRKLYEAAVAGDPWLHGKQLLQDVGSESFNLRSIFSRQLNWRDLIISNGRGQYRLHEDFPVPPCTE